MLKNNLCWAVWWDPQQGKMGEFDKDGIQVTEPRTGHCKEKIFERKKVTERRITEKNEIRRTTGNWENWKETVRHHGRTLQREYVHPCSNKTCSVGKILENCKEVEMRWNLGKVKSCGMQYGTRGGME